jgi:hypothetical protein
VSPAEQVAPEVHRRAPRASRSALTSDGATRVGGACGPSGRAAVALSHRPYHGPGDVAAVLSVMIRCACSARHRLTAHCTVRSCLLVKRSGCRALMRSKIAMAGMPGASANHAPI